MTNMTIRRSIIPVLAATLTLVTGSEAQTILPATEPLEASQDLAAEMVEGIHRYLDRATQVAASSRDRYWNTDFSSAVAYERSVEESREHLKSILGVVDQRLPIEALELVATTGRPARIAVGEGYEVHTVRWEALPGVFGEGLLLQPDSPPLARVVAIPDASWSPEMLAGIQSGVPSQSQFARRLAENGCQVIIPTLIDRTARWTSLSGVRESNLPHREFLFRMSYELGRHLVGYELQKVLAVIDFFEARNHEHDSPIGIIGYGEGGLLALYAAALDRRVTSVVASGYFQEREGLWQETIDRTVWGLLAKFGDAEIASLIAPRKLVIEASRGPDVAGAPPAPGPRADRAASGRLVSPPADSVRREFRRARRTYERLGSNDILLVEEGPEPGNEKSLQFLIDAPALRPSAASPRMVAALPDRDAQMRRQFDQIVAFNHRLVRDSTKRRDEFWARADSSSVRTWQDSTQHYRDYIWEELIGRLPEPDRPANPKTRKIYSHPDFDGYEVVLEVWEDVFAYGVLLVPTGLHPDEQRPVVVAQHGLEARPTDLVDPDVDDRAYHRYGARLAQEGFIVYAPQNPYIGQDRFRQLWRKAHPLKLSLYSFIVGQHQQTLAWLKSLPFVDDDRIGFYGLSYGGKTAMRIPPLLDDYALESVQPISTSGSGRTPARPIGTATSSRTSTTCSSSISPIWRTTLNLPS